MKQRITIEQLNELTDIQRQKLREWWKPKRGDCVFSECSGECFVYETSGSFVKFDSVYWADESRDRDMLENCIPLLSIGQMIEMLGEDWHKYILTAVRCEEDSWIEKDYDNELCDALWEAVKQIL